MKNKLVWVGMALVFFQIFSFLRVEAAGGMVWEAQKLTTSAFNKTNPVLAIANNKIYLAWLESDGSFNQVWTGEVNTDGTNFSAIKQTSSSYNKSDLRMEINGSKIFLVWPENDGSYQQIWTSSMDMDGSNFLAVKRTTSASQKIGPRMKTDGSKIYYVWWESSGIWTADMNIDGSNFAATQRTNTSSDRSPSFNIYNGKYYIVWSRYNATYLGTPTQHSTMLAQMNLDGSGWIENELDQSRYCGYYDQMPQMDVDNGNVVISYLKCEYSDLYSGYFVNSRLGKVNSALNGWDNERLLESLSSAEVNLDVFGNNSYFVWAPLNGGQLSTSTYRFSDYSWWPTVRTNSVYNKNYPELMVVDPYVYYVWSEKDAGNVYQIWTATESNQDILNDSTTVTATVPSSLTFTVAGVSSGTACANSGGNASVTSTSAAIPLGTYAGAQTKIACQTLTVSTNAGSGYIVSLEQNQDLTNASSNTMGKFTGTYTIPTVWSSPISPTKSFFGFTTDDTDLANFQTEKYAQLAINNTPYTIMQATHSVADEGNVISYQLEVNDLQEAGVYSNTLRYIVTGTF